jgi:hypothetical protein
MGKHKKRIPGLYKNKDDKIIADQSLRNIKLEEELNYINITFQFLDGNFFKLSIRKSFTLRQILNDIDKNILDYYYHNNDLHRKLSYNLIYKDELLNIDDVFSIKYDFNNSIINIIFIYHYIDKSIIDFYSIIDVEIDKSIYNIELNKNENNNIIGHIIIENIKLDNNDKYKYGCRCTNIICKHNYIKNLKNIEKCCNIFEKELSELCYTCFHNLIYIFIDIAELYNKPIMLLLNNDISDKFIFRFNNIINYCINIYQKYMHMTHTKMIKLLMYHSDNYSLKSKYYFDDWDYDL